MLMVICGAGASYDSWPSFPPDRRPRYDEVSRPPLANELFLHYDFFRVVSANYPQCQDLIPHLESQSDIEGVLEGFRAEAAQKPWRRKQLLATQFYIREVINKCQDTWLVRNLGVTNYRMLVDQLQPLNDVCFVTFNYDLLLEHALKAVGIYYPSISSYISGNPKLFKLHGSTDWLSWIPVRQMSFGGRHEQPPVSELIEQAPIMPESMLHITRNDEQCPESVGGFGYCFPALAIPVRLKSTFFCPPQHIEELKTCIRRVDKIAIVGWRASERHFLKMLAEGLQTDIDVFVACGKEEHSEGTLKNLEEAGVSMRNKTPSPYGFTHFVLRREIERLLQN